MVSSVSNNSSQSVIERKPSKENVIGKKSPIYTDKLNSVIAEPLHESIAGSSLQSDVDSKCSTLQILDYIPLVSTLKNLIDIVLKIVWRPDPSSLSPKAKAYFEHISQKSGFRCFIGLIPVLGNVIGATMDSDKKGKSKSLVRMAEEGQEEAFKELYHRGTSKQKEEAVEASFKASQHTAYCNAQRGQEALLEILENGEPDHKKKTLSWLMNNIQTWGSYTWEQWYEKAGVPEELKLKILEIGVKASISLKEGSYFYLPFLYEKLSEGHRALVIAMLGKAAEEGNDRAFSQLESLLRGRDTQRKLILQWFVKQAQNPSSRYFEKSWDHFRFGAELSFEQQKELCALCVQQALSAKGNKAQYDRAISFLESRFYSYNEQLKKLAFDQFVAIADKGDFAMMVRIANNYCTDTATRIHWLTRAANEGNHVEAMYDLAMRSAGKDTLKDTFIWLEKAANLGHIKSMLFLADLCRITDLKKALHWYQKAADLGDASAKAKVEEIKDQIKQEEKDAQADFDAQEEFRRFFENAQRNAHREWQQGAQQARANNFQSGVNYYKGKLESILGISITDASAFRKAIRTWSLVNHPDKVKDGNRPAAEARFKEVYELADKFKKAKSDLGESGWDYK